ncbi:MAG: hypothetical protein KC545_09100, partial [Nitrospira sp.]|nr:hypothetical protein [Nitrospira sp.]
LPTNSQLARRIMEIYQETQSWTWYDSWDWPSEEIFFKEATLGQPGIPFGRVLPMNLIIKPPLPPSTQSIPHETKLKRIRKFVGLG